MNRSPTAWKKSTRSASESNCVELAHVWRKSTRSSSQSNCVELAHAGLVRDSKNPDGPRLHADMRTLLAAVKAGRLDC